MWRPDRVDRPKPAAPSDDLPATGGGGGFSFSRGSRTAAAAKQMAPAPRAERLPLWLWAVLAVLVVQRCIYHYAYLTYDPFALVTISEGQLYERAARDILAHPYWGSEPFYLDGLYAYLLATGIALSDSAVAGLGLQLLAAGIAIALFASGARRCFGKRTGAYSLAVLLALPSLSFYENKYASVSLGVASSMLVLWAFSRLMTRPTIVHAAVLGLSVSFAALAAPNLILVLPFSAIAVVLVGQRRTVLARSGMLVTFLLAAGLALLPMATRNLVVTGSPTVLPSHVGALPFFMGNNPDSNGLWNDAGGLLGGPVGFERAELAQRLGLDAPAAQLDAALGDELYRRAFAFITEKPLAWLFIEFQKVWYALGNHAFVHDYDWFGERELLGLAHPIGLPFGVGLGIGTLGLSLLLRRTLQARHEAAHAALCCVLFGLALSVLAANLFWFTSAQHRAVLLVPLAFAAGPAIETIVRRLRGSLPSSELPAAAWIVALLLTVQAFFPRSPVDSPSSTHYYNLGHVQEILGRPEAALASYARATERNPKQPMFWWRRAHVARELRRLDEAKKSLDRLLALPDLPPDLKQATSAARRSLD